MKCDVHDPPKCIGALAQVRGKSDADRTAISDAIACINHLRNVVQRQRKHLSNIEGKKP